MDDDRMIHDLTSTDRLLFMVLDQLKRMEDRLDDQERWQNFQNILTMMMPRDDGIWIRTLRVIFKKMTQEQKDVFLKYEFSNPTSADMLGKILDHYGIVSASDIVMEFPGIRAKHSDVYDRIINGKSMAKRGWALLTLDQIRELL